jgi:hypothetical protein
MRPTLRLRIAAKLRFFLVLGLLGGASFLCLATSTVPPRYTVPTRAFMDYCGVEGPWVEVLVTNDTNRPVLARFLGPSTHELEVAPGSNRMFLLAPGDYAFELTGETRYPDRQWQTFKSGRRYLYFHRG